MICAAIHPSDKTVHNCTQQFRPMVEKRLKFAILKRCKFFVCPHWNQDVNENEAFRIKICGNIAYCSV